MLTILKKLLNLIPALIILLWIYAEYIFFKSPNIYTAGFFFISIYLIPPLTYRLFAFFNPIKIGISYLGKGHPPNGWMMALRFQQPYNVLRFLERVLILFPGVYSFWLRLWGSKIGKNVFWTSDTIIMDRTNLIIEDNVVIGNRSYLSSHVGKIKNGEYMIFIKPIHLKKGCFIGTHCMLGPGTNVEEGQAIDAAHAMIYNKLRKPVYEEV
jgi:hypothetical protein